jgi:hypothetical protein
MQRQINDSESNSLPTAIRIAADPDARFAEAFRKFRALFKLEPDADASNILLPAYSLYVPDLGSPNREALGAAITGAILAMLDHAEERARGDWAEKSLLELPGIVHTMPAEIRDRLDQIVLAQGEITGGGLCASDLVLARILYWEQNDGRKYDRWLAALAKASRVRRRETYVPLVDPFWHEVKRAAVEQLRPFVTRLKERVGRLRRCGTDEIFAVFESEAKHPDSPPLLTDEHNLERWLCFFRREPAEYVLFSPEKLFDEFVAFVTTHKVDYTRKMISSPRYK